jgi:hypothetical protein
VVSEVFVDRFASVLYESDNVIESWSDAHQVDRDEYLAIARREVRALLDAHAHELAEKIRTELPETVKEALAGGVWTITTVPTAEQAADLIDPEVQK